MSLKEEFKYNGRTCLIMQMKDWHNGYVETLPENFGTFYMDEANSIECEELTFSGQFLKYGDHLKGKWFIGFDTMHYYNTQNPSSQTHKSVKKATKKLCEEMVKHNL